MTGSEWTFKKKKVEKRTYFLRHEALLIRWSKTEKQNPEQVNLFNGVTVCSTFRDLLLLLNMVCNAGGHSLLVTERSTFH